MKIKHILTTMLLLLIFTTGCKKDNEIGIEPQILLENNTDPITASDALNLLTTEEEKSFFDKFYISTKNPFIIEKKEEGETRGDLDEFINEIYEEMLIQNSKMDFVPSLTNSVGFPIWDRAIVLFEEGDDSMVGAIPFANVSDRNIQAYLLAIPDYRGEWHFTLAERTTLNEMVNLNKGPDYDNLKYHVINHLKFDLELFKNQSENQLQWLYRNGRVQHEDGLASMRCVTVITTTKVSVPCPENLQAANFDGIGCFELQTTYSIECFEGDPGFNSGTSSSPGWTPSGGGGGGNGSGNGINTYLQNLKSLCDTYNNQTGDEGPGEGISLTEHQKKQCAALAALETSGFSTEEMYNILNNSIFSAILDYLALNGLHNIEANKKYYEMIQNGTTDLTLKRFHIMFNIIHNVLKPTLGLNNNEVDFLMANLYENNLIAQQINNFLTNNNIQDPTEVLDIANLHLDQLISSPDYYEMNELMVTIPPWMWTFVREVAIEVVIEIIKKQFPASTIGPNLIEALRAIQQGDLLEFVYKAADIAKTFSLPIKIFDGILDTYNLAGKAAKAYKAINKLENFSSEIIEKLLNVVKSRTGKLLDSIKWKKNVGIQLFGETDPIEFFDDLQNALPTSIITPMSTFELQPQDLAGFWVHKPKFKIIIKYGGNTNPNGFTLELTPKNKPVIKIRFM